MPRTKAKKQKVFVVGQNMDQGSQIFGVFTTLKRAQGVRDTHAGLTTASISTFWVQEAVLNEEDFVARAMK